METTPVSTASRTLKVRAVKSVDATAGKSAKTVTVKRKPKAKSIIKPEATVKPAAVAATGQQEMIATAAYFIAQQRNFAPGDELSDWLIAEQQLRTVTPSS